MKNNKGNVNAISLVFALVLIVGGVAAYVVTHQKPTEVAPVAELPGSTSTLNLVDDPYTSIGGLQSYSKSVSLAATSSVFVSIKNPFAATSTVVLMSLQTTSNGMGAQTFDVSTSSTNVGSSTPALGYGVSVGATRTSYVWSPATTTNGTVIGAATSGNGVSNIILGPNEYLNFRIASGTPGTFAAYLKGNVNVLIRKL